MIVLLLPVAWAADGVYESETVLQARHDFFGEPLTPLYQYVRVFDQVGPVDVSAYAGAEWSAGVDEPVDPELYLLEARGRVGWARWTLGRQQAVDLFRPQTFDGARVELTPMTRDPSVRTPVTVQPWMSLAPRSTAAAIRELVVCVGSA